MNSMDQVLQAIRELQGQMTRFEENMNARMTKLETRMDKLESRMGGLETRMDKLESRMTLLEEKQQDTLDNITILVKENWDHKKDLPKVKRRVGMEQ
jgi:predicted  nucleic acid-binding Zn-ribbon protein